MRHRRSRAWHPVALAAGGSALVAATWMVAQLSWLGRLRSLEAEVSFLRRTRRVDVPRLLNDLERLAGPAADRLDAQVARERQLALRQELQAARAELAALRRSRRLEERFTLAAGSSRLMLEGKVHLRLEGVEAGGARVELAGAPSSLWRPGDFRDLNFGGGRYRLTLEALPEGAAGPADFRLDALLDVSPLPGGSATPAGAMPAPLGR